MNRGSAAVHAFKGHSPAAAFFAAPRQLQNRKLFFYTPSQKSGRGFPGEFPAALLSYQ